MNIGGEFIAFVIKIVWQKTIGPKINSRVGISCRFYPTCSEYSIRAFRKYGIRTGLVKTLGRLKRCNKFNTESCIDYP